MKKKHIAIVGVILAVWIGIIGFLIIKSKVKEIKSSKNIERYIIPEQKKVFINGVAEPTQSKVFYKDMTKGESYTIHKNNGDSVNKGSLLITYKNGEVSNQIKDLNDQLYDLQKEKKKTKDNNINQLNQDQMAEPIEEQIKNTSEELSKLKNKEYSYEYAPFAGKAYTDNKDMNVENQELLKLRSTEFYIKSEVTENELEKIKEDHEVEILILANDKKVKGKITEISDEPKSQEVGLNGEIGETKSVSSYPINITLDSQEGIVNGYHVQIKLKLSNKEPKIPTSAIKVDKHKNYVYLIKDDKLVKRFVEVKRTEGDLSIITSGLKEKDEIVKVTTNEMKEGQKIE